MSIYICAAIVNSREAEIYSTEKYMPTLHNMLSSIPDYIDIAPILESAKQLFKKYPPNLLLTKLSDEYIRTCI